MANIMDYIEWRGDLSFEQDPFNEVDNLVLSEIIYVNQRNIFPREGGEKTIRQVATEFFRKHKEKELYVGIFFDKCMGEFAQKLGKSERFGNIRVMRRINRVDKNGGKQFCAVTFEISPDLYYIAFKGTDDSLVGWWEDLNTLATYPVSAQKKAVEYARHEMKRFPNAKFIFGGHSKGGNLAVYAAYQLGVEERERLVTVYSNDGQGFTPGKFERKKYERIQDKVIQIVPEDCLVGNLLEEYPCKRIVVKPLVKGIMEHDCFQWSVKGSQFVTVPDISQKSKNTREGFKAVVSGLTPEDKQNLIDELYEMLKGTPANTLTELLKLDGGLLVPRIARKMSGKNSKLFLSLARICIMNGMIF